LSEESPWREAQERRKRFRKDLGKQPNWLRRKGGVPIKKKKNKRGGGGLVKRKLSTTRGKIIDLVIKGKEYILSEPTVGKLRGTNARRCFKWKRDRENSRPTLLFVKSKKFKCPPLEMDKRKLWARSRDVPGVVQNHPV